MEDKLCHIFGILTLAPDKEIRLPGLIVRRSAGIWNDEQISPVNEDNTPWYQCDLVRK